MRERLVTAIMEVKKCTYQQAEAMLMAAAREWERKLKTWRVA